MSFSMCIFIFVSFIQISLSFNIICNNIDTCQDYKLICNPNDNCYISCNGQDSCRETNIICPSGDNNCIIDVNGQRALYESYINSSLMDGGNLLINATGLNAIYGTNIDCPPNGHCNITSYSYDNAILGSSSIKSHPSTQLLYIYVADSNSLEDANIICPHPTTNYNKNCIINSMGVEALTIISVYGSINVLLTCNSTSECWYEQYPTLSCTPYFNSICEMGAIDGIFDCVDTSAVCYGDNSAVFGYEMIDDFILCFGTYSCGHHSYYQTHTCSNQKDCYIYCGGLYACMYASFECPTDYDCIVTANGRYSMYSADTVNAQYSKGNLLINGYGDAALDRLTIRCPENGGSCVINVSGGGYQMISDLKIYGVEYDSDLNLKCEYIKGISSDCYYSEAPPQMYCDLDQSFCLLHLIEGFDGFECNDTSSLCHGTRSPTANPITSAPTTPTINPTTSTPTKEPTDSPIDESSDSNSSSAIIGIVIGSIFGVLFLIIIIVIIIIKLVNKNYKFEQSTTKQDDNSHNTEMQPKPPRILQNNNIAIQSKPKVTDDGEYEYKEQQPSAPVFVEPMQQTNRTPYITGIESEKTVNIKPSAPMLDVDPGNDVNNHQMETDTDLNAEGDGYQVNNVLNKYPAIKDFFYNTMSSTLIDEDKLKYSKLFISEGFDTTDIIKILKDDDLMKIGITKFGHRKMMLNKIDEL